MLKETIPARPSGEAGRGKRGGKDRFPPLAIKAREGPGQAGNARILGISEGDAYKD
jgi:hypothetical protein